MCIKAQSVYYPSDSYGALCVLKEQIKANDFSIMPLQFGIKVTDSSKNVLLPTFSNTDNRFLLTDNLFYKNYKKDTTGKRKEYLFYQYKGHFWASKNSDYCIKINPVLYLGMGKQSIATQNTFQNTRGIEIAGNIGGTKKGVGFYTYFTDNQIILPQQYQYMPDSLNFVPGELFFKPFKNKGAEDYFQARGYITFNAVNNHIKFQFGHDKNKIGNGYRSLILSDFAPQYLFFKINTHIGKFNYQNLFTQFTDNGKILGNTLFGKKYGAFHRLSFDVLPNLNIGLNEMVIFDRMDSTQSNQFELNYLNPVIFYRSVESNLGSRDNSLLAADLNYILKKKYFFYGQLLLDELSFRILKTNRYWWGNKYGYQLGVRAINLFKIPLDIQLEHNMVRPYTYSHYRTTQSYSHFNQALAHPLGANFSENLISIQYCYKNKWFIDGHFIYAKMGIDSSLQGANYGNNILRDYNTRAVSNDAFLYIGKKTTLLNTGITLSYMPMHQIFIDIGFNYRKFNNTQNTVISAALRYNFSRKKFDY